MAPIDAAGNIHSDMTGQFTGHVRTEADPATVMAVSGGGAEALLTDADRIYFGDGSIRELHRISQDSIGSVGRLASERCSLVRTRRLALLAAHHFPGATAVEIEDGYQGDSACMLNAVILADGNRVDAEDLDPEVYGELNDEAFDIYDNNDAWKAAAAQRGDAWVVDIGKASAISGADYERGWLPPTITA